MPSILVRLRPTGPWRIGPDSGDRDRVERIYHSDALYSAVCGAMSRLGTLEEWLDATARSAEPALCFSSCFPFHNETLYVIPPQHLWPPPASSKVRWKGARFVPFAVVESLLAGKPLSEDAWIVDGESECLVPATSTANAASGSTLFRASVRSSAAVDRSGVGAAPHSVACLEFTTGSGFWFIASFADDAARERWSEPFKAAIRLLADSGFGGERSRGWGRSQAPEFREDEPLPTHPAHMIGASAGSARPSTARYSSASPNPAPIPAAASHQSSSQQSSLQQSTLQHSMSNQPPFDPASSASSNPASSTPASSTPASSTPESSNPASVTESASHQSSSYQSISSQPLFDPASSASPIAASPDPLSPDPAAPKPTPPDPPSAARPAAAQAQSSRASSPAGETGHWLLSLYHPAPDDAVNWQRGNYSLTTRGGRIESESGWGQIKKNTRMVAEGSVVVATAQPRGAAADVAPDGFPHPVYRSGFAFSLPVPLKVSP